MQVEEAVHRTQHAELVARSSAAFPAACDETATVPLSSLARRARDSIAPQVLSHQIVLYQIVFLSSDVAVNDWALCTPERA